MSRLSATLLAVVMLAPWVANQAAGSPGKEALEKAAKNNKYLFIFFYAANDSQTAAMNGVFRAAMAKMSDRADALKVYLDDPAEQPVVEKFGVRGAPLPLVLAIAPTGAATKAFPKQFDEAQLQQAFVSPCTAKCMKAIQDRHSILLCVQNGKTRFNQEALQGCQEFQADPQYARGTEIIALNPTDEAERPFLKALEVDPQTAAAVTVLITPPGAPVAHFVGAVTKSEIEAKVQEAKSCCGPNCKCHQQ